MWLRFQAATIGGVAASTANNSQGQAISGNGGGGIQESSNTASTITLGRRRR